MFRRKQEWFCFIHVGPPLSGCPRDKAGRRDLSVTGVYIWWKKQKARRFRKAHGASARAPLEATIAEEQ
jgi:hypothetical protein